MSVCVKCSRGDHEKCWGFDGPMTEHPDSLPLCNCCHPNAEDNRTTPVDGELREALAEALYRGINTYLDDPEAVDGTEPDLNAGLDEQASIIAAHVAEEKRKLREEIEAELASVPAEWYPEDVFGPGLSSDDTRNIRQALAPLGITLDRISAAVMRHAYKNAARIARGDE